MDGGAWPIQICKRLEMHQYESDESCAFGNSIHSIS